MFEEPLDPIQLLLLGVSGGSGEAPVAPGVNLAAPSGRGLRAPRIWLLGSHTGPDFFALKSFIERRGYRLVKELRRPGARLVLLEPTTQLTAVATAAPDG